MNKFDMPKVGVAKMQDSFFAPRQKINRAVTIPSAVRRCEETGRWSAFKLDWKPGTEPKPHYFWDSDVAKVLEGMAYELMLRPDAKLEAELEKYIALVLSAQHDDGYLNVYFTVVEPENQWKKLYICHELYCCGHLIEAAVAHYLATGKTHFLDAMRRYADLIAKRFGNAPGQVRGTSGHPEIELALCKLFGVTGERRYLELARYFIDERGRQPNVFTAEGSSERYLWEILADKPVMEQTEATGHAVRAVYLYAGMASVASATGDRELAAQCEKMFDSIVEHKMYVTGGIGVEQSGETFGKNDKLPNDTSYAESCAAMGLALFAARMHNLTGEIKYLDAMETAMYNGVYSGLSLSGDEFFYQNPLASNRFRELANRRMKWFDCSCCPTSFSRFTPQVGSLVWSASEAEVRLNIPAASVFDDGKRRIAVSGGYPYEGDVTVEIKRGGDFAFSMRIPQYCEARVTLDGKPVAFTGRIATLKRKWQGGEIVHMTLALPVTILRSRSGVYADSGRIALRRGPLVYAAESCDIGFPPEYLLFDPEQKFQIVAAHGLGRGVKAIRGTARREEKDDSRLYSAQPPRMHKTSFRAVPYALWLNREPGEMALWLREWHSR